jgi:hypothetical protein
MTCSWQQLSAPGVGIRSDLRLRISDFRLRRLLSGLAAGLALNPCGVWACAACYGQSDSPMAQGMNWGIFSLLAVVVVVLGGVAAFFVFLARRSAALAAGSAAGTGEQSVAAPGFAVAPGRNGGLMWQGMSTQWRLAHKCGAPQAVLGCAPERMVESNGPLL